MGQVSGTKNDDEINNNESSIQIVSKAGNDFIRNSGSNVQIYSGTGNDTIYSETVSSGNYVEGGYGDDLIVSFGEENTLKGGPNKDDIFLSSSSEVVISGNKIYGDDGDDRIVIDDSMNNEGSVEVNVINGGLGDDIIDLNDAETSSIIEYADGDGNDVVYGYKSIDRIRLTDESDFTTILSGEDVIVQVGTGVILLAGAADKDVHITKYSVLPDMQYSNNYKNLTLNQYFNGTLKDYNSKVKTIDAREVNNQIEIIGNAQNNSIHGGNKNDTIYGGKGNDKLYGGYGDDVFVYNDGDGNDTIYDYAEGKDVIKINKSIKSTSIGFLGIGFLGNDFVFKLGNGKITVKNGKTKKIEVIDKDNNSTYYGTYLTVTENDSDVVKAASNVLDIDLTKRKKNIKITANSKANTINGGSGIESIYGGSGDDFIFGNAGADKLFGDKGNDLIDGGKGNDSITGGNGNDILYGNDGADTLVGGSGNDTLMGGIGKDVFVYSGGKDVITDYTEGKDKIKILNKKISKFSIVDNDVVFKIGLGSLTIKDAVDKKITVTDSTGTSTKSYSIMSPVNFEERLFEDDNFINDDISSILPTTSDYANNNSLGQVTINQDFTSLTKNKQSQIVTYSYDKK